MPPKSFEERYEIMESENKNSENFIFPEESSETKNAIDKAENKINDSVKIFANNLDWISPWLTQQLLKIFDEYKKEKDSKFSWLSESDLWLHSLGDLYNENKDKISGKMEGILREMLGLLTQYKTLKEKSKSLEEMLRACACVAKSDVSDWDISWLKNQPPQENPETPSKESDLPSAPFFKPTSSCNRWWRFS